jgi:HNH endonuclease
VYCPYCNATHDATVTTSLEHVIPYALGGSDELTITTCEEKNNELGSEVDAPFIDFFPVRSKRFFLGLRSTGGKEPTLELGGKGLIGGKEVPVSYSITKDTKELKIAKPEIKKTPTTSGEHWQISGDPAQVREILKGKLRKQIEKGKTITLQDGSHIRLEEIDKLIAASDSVTLNPSVIKTIDFDYLITTRFFCKTALAMGHFHLGDAFSRSACGAELRRLTRVKSWEDVRLRGAAIWPETEPVKHSLKLISKADQHMIAILDGTPPVLLVSLFGEFGALIPLAEFPQARYPVPSGEGSVWRIELPSRRLTKLSLRELIAERAEERKFLPNNSE